MWMMIIILILKVTYALGYINKGQINVVSLIQTNSKPQKCVLLVVMVECLLLEYIAIKRVKNLLNRSSATKTLIRPKISDFVILIY